MFESCWARRGGGLTAATLWVGLASFPLAAHDFWIEPSTYQPEPGTTVRLGLKVGEDFSGSTVLRNRSRVERFVAAGPRGQNEVHGLEGKSPAGFVPVHDAGLYVVGYHGNRSSIRLDAERFENYLAAEGLDHVSELRAQRGETGEPGREVFSRSAKTLIQPLAGEPGQASLRDHPLGLPLELVLLNRPAALVPDNEVRARVLFRGRPAVHVQVQAIAKERPQHGWTGRSDRRGEVVFRIDQPGPWLVKAVHMVEAPAGIDADWESFWASLTFAVNRPVDLRGP